MNARDWIEAAKERGAAFTIDSDDYMLVLNGPHSHVLAALREQVLADEAASGRQLISEIRGIVSEWTPTSCDRFTVLAELSGAQGRRRRCLACGLSYDKHWSPPPEDWHRVRDANDEQITSRRAAVDAAIAIIAPQPHASVRRRRRRRRA